MLFWCISFDIVIPHCVAKSRNSAGVNFCTRSLKTTTITWHLHAPVRYCGQTGNVPLYKVKYRVSRYRFDGATKEISIHLSNIDTTIYMLIFLSHCRVRVRSLFQFRLFNQTWAPNISKAIERLLNWYQFDNRLLALSVLDQDSERWI